MTHQVVHARSDIWRGAEEDGRVSEDLLEAGILHCATHLGGEWGEQQRDESADAREHVTAQKGANIGETRVEKTPLGDLVDVACRLEVLLHSAPGSRLDTVEQL